MLDTIRRPVSRLVDTLPASVSIPGIVPADIRDGIAALCAYLRREPQLETSLSFATPGPVTRRPIHNLYRC